ncbi:MAG: hypothetical protein JNM89_08200 [Hyphomicrobiaceae bacterium]|nr:hypothetical protein [Hyphomicrobiaceae bacterium]
MSTAAGIREAAERKLARLQRVFLIVGIVYLTLHALVSLAAYMERGVLAGLATLLTLGFGDLYWAFAWAGETGFQAERYAAIVAAVMAFTSWTTRRWTNRYIYRLAAASMTSLDDAGGSEEQWGSSGTTRGQTVSRDTAGGAAATDDRPGGAA